MKSADKAAVRIAMTVGARPRARLAADLGGKPISILINRMYWLTISAQYGPTFV